MGRDSSEVVRRSDRASLTCPIRTAKRSIARCPDSPGSRTRTSPIPTHFRRIRFFGVERSQEFRGRGRSLRRPHPPGPSPAGRGGAGGMWKGVKLSHRLLAPPSPPRRGGPGGEVFAGLRPHLGTIVSHPSSIFPAVEGVSYPRADWYTAGRTNSVHGVLFLPAPTRLAPTPPGRGGGDGRSAKKEEGRRPFTPPHPAPHLSETSRTTRDFPPPSLRILHGGTVP